MESGPVVATDRHSRRKAATRAALVRATRELLVEVGPEMSVQAIADRADVGLGSFYNHFGGKPDAVGAAATDALLEFEAFLVSRTHHLEGILTIFAARLRLFGRMPDSHPEIATVMLLLPPSAEAAPHGYSLRALADVEAAIAAGELVVDDLDIRLIAAAGAMRNLVGLRQRDPGIGPERVDDLVAVLLGMFGVDGEQAEELAHGPLPG